METSKFFSLVEEFELDEGYQKTYKSFDEVLPTLSPRKGWWLDQLFITKASGSRALPSEEACCSTITSSLDHRRHRRNIP
ncbi:hypothetical protein V6N13_076688 [Hibiscus sabdariffa]